MQKTNNKNKDNMKKDIKVNTSNGTIRVCADGKTATLDDQTGDLFNQSDLLKAEKMVDAMDEVADALKAKLKAAEQAEKAESAFDDAVEAARNMVASAGEGYVVEVPENIDEAEDADEAGVQVGCCFFTRQEARRVIAAVKKQRGRK